VNEVAQTRASLTKFFIWSMSLWRLAKAGVLIPTNMQRTKEKLNGLIKLPLKYLVNVPKV
jgi:hypothetical protein